MIHIRKSQTRCLRFRVTANPNSSGSKVGTKPRGNRKVSEPKRGYNLRPKLHKAVSFNTILCFSLLIPMVSPAPLRDILHDPSSLAHTNATMVLLSGVLLVLQIALHYASRFLHNWFCPLRPPRLNVIRTKRNPYLSTIKAKIDGLEFTVLLDTGAEISIAPISFAQKLNRSLIPKYSVTESATGGVLSVCCSTCVSLRLPQAQLASSN